MSYWVKRKKYQRERQARWDAAHMRTISTKVSVAEAKRLHEAAAAEGSSLYEVLRELSRAWLGVRDAEMLAEPDAAERVMV